MDNDTLVSIDPGVRSLGVAVFEEADLVDCDLVECNVASGPAQWSAMSDRTASRIREMVGGVPDKLAIERMETRPGRDDAHEDLFQLTYISGGIYALLRACPNKMAVRPSDWTHSRPKKINHRRVHKRLKGTDSHDVLKDRLGRMLADDRGEVLDAVAIGLHVLNQFG